MIEWRVENPDDSEEAKSGKPILIAMRDYGAGGKAYWHLQVVVYDGGSAFPWQDPDGEASSWAPGLFHAWAPISLEGLPKRVRRKT